jgi:hypothetical protein
MQSSRTGYSQCRTRFPVHSRFPTVLFCRGSSVPHRIRGPPRVSLHTMQLPEPAKACDELSRLYGAWHETVEEYATALEGLLQMLPNNSPDSYRDALAHVERKRLASDSARFSTAKHRHEHGCVR